MRIRYFLIGLLIPGIFSCAGTADEKVTGDSVTHTNLQSNVSVNADWTTSFLKLSTAIIQGEKNALKKFIDFPVKSTGNEIWLLADSKLVMEMDSERIKPFTEPDYEKYFSSVFTIDLRKTLEKLDTALFFKTFESSSPEMEVVKDSKSSLEARFDKSSGKLTLHLLNTGSEFEFSVLYEFEFTPEQTFKFRQVHIAG